ncbi:MAG TPA: alpha/beta fold hydrolase [Solirubrobacteraceae bacterium]|nr:alpha/beta fold hydrolase [Solirubrobacteraceae bacterium]
MDDQHAGRARFWIGAGGEAPMYVERTGTGAQDRPALVLIHGGGGQGLDWLGTPDGRPGWAPELARRGHRVFTVDRPGHGRGAQWAGALGEMGEPLPAEGLAVLFRSPDGVHPTAHLHTQWPGDGGPPGSDPAILQMLASCRSMPTDLAVAHALEARLGAELIDRVGPSVLFTHSAGAPAGWLIAAERPQLVRAVVALEPFGPPFRPAADGVPGLPHGLTAMPLGDLSDVPVLLVTAEASLLGHFDTEVRDYLAEAGARVQLLRLADHGVHGNGHGMIFERNHLQVLDVVMEQLTALLAAAAAAAAPAQK